MSDAAIIAVGSEMLGTTRLDTNSLRSTAALEDFVVSLVRKSIVGDRLDDLANDAMKRELARRFFESNRREAEARRGDMTDEEVEAEVDRAVHDYRSEQRSR